MTSKNILMIFGTRPEAIKMAPLYHELNHISRNNNVITCVTAQHRQMLDQVLSHFNIVPNIDLNLMKSGQDLYDITAAILLNLKKTIDMSRPNLILVHGDTTTCMTAALAGFYSGIKVGHVEAGLRTHDITSPFPEEFNRVVTSKIASIHFAPTLLAQQNLINEGVSTEKIYVTGNTVIDALKWTINRFENDLNRKLNVKKRIASEIHFDIESTIYILITGHRRENFGDGFSNIARAIAELANKYKDIEFIYPVHLNPKAREPVYEKLINIKNVHLIKPVEYEAFVYLMKNCLFVLSDSGGIQEEAPSLGKPVLVMRESTERPEAVKAGTVKIIGSNTKDIIHSVSELIDDEDKYIKMSKSVNPYGDGNASTRISDIIDNLY